MFLDLLKYRERCEFHLGSVIISSVFVWVSVSGCCMNIKIITQHFIADYSCKETCNNCYPSDLTYINASLIYMALTSQLSGRSITYYATLW